MKLTEYYSRVALRSSPDEDEGGRLGAKGKEWDPNPWAVCHEQLGRKKTKKFERCVQDVKRKQSSVIKNGSRRQGAVATGDLSKFARPPYHVDSWLLKEIQKNPENSDVLDKIAGRYGMPTMRAIQQALAGGSREPAMSPRDIRPDYWGGR